MKQWIWIKWITGVMMIMCMYVILFIPLQHQIDIILALMLFILFALFLLAERMKFEFAIEMELDENQRFNDRRLIEKLTHQRHDFLNDLQVLFGYVRLGKTEKIIPYMEKIKNGITNESKITHLEIPYLIVYILTFTIDSHGMELNFKITDSLSLANKFSEPERAADLIIETIQLFDENALDQSKHSNYLKFELNDGGDALELNCFYTGHYNMGDFDVGYDELIRQYRKQLKIEEKSELKINEATIQILIKYAVT